MDNSTTTTTADNIMMTDDDNNNNSNNGLLLGDASVSVDSSTSSLFAVVVSNFLLFGLIFGLSATVEVRKLKSQLRNKFALLTGISMQFLIMPLLGYLSVLALRDQEGFTQAMGITLLVVTSSPGGSYSNWWCSLFNADLALSVAMTAVSTILSVGMLPANLLLYSYAAFGQDEEESILAALDFGALFISLGIVMGAILSGLYTSYVLQSKSFSKWANSGASICGVGLILVSFFLSSGGGGGESDEEENSGNSNWWNQGWAFYIGVAFPCLIGMATANALSRCSGRLRKPEIVSIAVECCYQNTGIATSVAVTMFSDNPTQRAQAVAVPLLYGVVEALVIGLYCIVAWKVGWTKAPQDERVCTVVFNSYEHYEYDANGNVVPPPQPSSLEETITTSQKHLSASKRSSFGEEEEDYDGVQDLPDLEHGASSSSSPRAVSRHRLVSEDVTVMTQGTSGSGAGAARPRTGSIASSTTDATTATAAGLNTTMMTSSTTPPSTPNKKKNHTLVPPPGTESKSKQPYKQQEGFHWFGWFGASSAAAQAATSSSSGDKILLQQDESSSSMMEFEC